MCFARMALPISLDTSDEKVLYVDAVKYLNKRVLELVDNLLSKSEYLGGDHYQGDHGVHKLELTTSKA